MLRLFLATEADEGLGHVVPWTGFVTQALARGYEVHMAAPDVGMLNQHVGSKYPVQLWSSPGVRRIAQWQHSTQPSVKSWAELLVSLGYGQPTALQGAVKAWRSILGQVRPCVVLADYAPALILAARTLDIPVLEVGSGFCVPPLTPHLQSFPGIKNCDAAALAHADTQLARAYNECLTSFGKPCISSMADVQAWPASRLVMSPPELDPYDHRAGVAYAGLLQPVAQDTNGDDPTQWPPVVGYLKGSTPGLNALIDQLEDARIHALIYVAGTQNPGQTCRGTVTLTDKPISLSHALPHANVYLSNGGLSGIGQALQHGCWPVVVPQQAEQVATARNLLQRQWGAMWLPNSPNSVAQSMLPVVASRLRRPRFADCVHAEVTLLQAIQTLPSCDVPPA